MKNKTFGTYNDDKNIMYINPNVYGLFTDPKDAFAFCADTVFHETRHAVQFKTIKSSDEISYDNLLMAMDKILSLESLGFYDVNYKRISFERDARDMAYVDTMTFFREYPEMQQLISQEEDENYSISDFIRYDSTLTLMGIIDGFVKEVNDVLADYKDDEEILAIKINEIKQFPVIKQFFDFDEANLRIEPKSDEYFNSLLETLDPLKDGEAIYSINTFIYSRKVSKYMKDHEIDMLINEPSLDAVEGEVIDNVGKRPTR